MAKQQFTFSLSAQQVREAIEAYVTLMVDPKTHDVTLTGMLPNGCTVTATKRRVRKPKMASVKVA